MLSNYYHKDGLRHAQNVVWGRGPTAAGAVPLRDSSVAAG